MSGTTEIDFTLSFQGTTITAIITAKGKKNNTLAAADVKTPFACFTSSRMNKHVPIKETHLSIYAFWNVIASGKSTSSVY